MKEQTLSLLVSSGLLAVLLAVAMSALKLGKAWLDAKTEELRERISSQKVRDALAQGETAVWNAVLQTAQLEADAFRKAAEDGKLTDEEKAKLRNIAKERALSFLTEDAINLIRENVRDFDEWLNALIEKVVRADNARQAAAAKGAS
jgi:cyanate lyase